ncbi:MAG: 4-hydroxybenzoate 3-monooxygenase [Actinomycetota bacterium]|nr:4-hydroxybenzoate 3-monooxygenase [Actinomycetota bacterium]
MSGARTQVAILGAGPAGLFLSHLLARAGIDSIVLECHSRDYLEHRIRAGVVEHGIAKHLDAVGLGERMRREGLVHHGIELRFDGRRHRIAMSELAGNKTITVYGQQEIVKDLVAARLAAGGDLRFGAEALEISDVLGPTPTVRYRHDGIESTITCEVVAGCDGFHGISRQALPPGAARAFERVHPFAWLGILAEVAPSTDELIYCRHDRGFALHSMRSFELSRFYLQVAPDEPLERWSDAAIWAELRRRFATEDGFELADGPIIERSITTMRSFILEPQAIGSLVLAGDAAHIVPPTGAKGMNLALADVRDLAHALIAKLVHHDESFLKAYSAACVRRAWHAQEFSTFMTTLLHPLAGDDFNNHLQLARLEELTSSRDAARHLAERYVDLASMRLFADATP